MKLIDKFNGLTRFYKTLILFVVCVITIGVALSVPDLTIVFLVASFVGLFWLLCYFIVLLIETF